MADSPPDDKARRTPNPAFTPSELAVEEIASKLEGSSIEEILRIQDHFAKLVRERFERPVAVLFSDIAGSTAYFERYGDTEGRRMIQRHNDLLMPIIQDRGGRVVKTIGDAIMATFPSANLAVDAAISMQQGTSEHNSRVSHEEERFEIRIGVNYGTALLNEKDGDVHGDMVNVAARVQSQAHKGEIYVSDAVREYLSPTIPLRLVGRFAPKGKSQEMQLYEVAWRELARPEVQLDKPKLGPRYAILDLLGTGGMAAVWRARDERLGRDVALKVLHGHMQMAIATRARFQREARVAAQLVHENVVQVYDFSSEGPEQSFIAMELIDGQTLRAFLDDAAPVPSSVAILLAHEVARGLAHAHSRGVVHRDLKPENVLLSKAGAVKIGDFGIAVVGEMARLTNAGTPVGTPAYLSPEQVKGQTADMQSDVFALGVLMYERVTGKAPFAAETPHAVMYRIVEGNFVAPEKLSSVDRDMAALIKRCLSKEPKDRPEGAAAVEEALRKMLLQRKIMDPRAALEAYFSDAVVPGLRGKTGETYVPRTFTKRHLVGAMTLTFAVVAGTVLLIHRATLPAPAVAPSVHIAPTQPTPPPREPVVAVAPIPEPPASPPVEGAEARKEEPKRVAAAVRQAKPEKRPAAPTVESTAAPEPKNPPATINLRVDVWAIVKIDGASVGRAPILRSIPVAPSKHVLELENPHRKPYRTEVYLEPGATLDHAVVMEMP